MNALFFSRIDYREKDERKMKKKLEFVWSVCDNYNYNTNSILTHIFSNHYDYPAGFCLGSCGKSILITEDNVASKSVEFINYIKEMS